MKRHVKNPKARKEAARRLLMAMSKRKAMMKGAVNGNGTSNKEVPRDSNPENMDSGNPGTDLR